MKLIFTTVNQVEALISGPSTIHMYCTSRDD